LIKVDTYGGQIREFIDGDGANYETMQILVASDGLPRVELFKEGTLVDTVYVFRYSVPELNNFLTRDLGLPRNPTRTWKSINAEMELSKAIFEATGGFEGHKEEIEAMREAVAAAKAQQTDEL
jgi:hypothetical protein